VASLKPLEPLPTGAARRDRPLAWQVVASVAVHSAILLMLLWPALRQSLEAAPPAAIDVELVVAPSEPRSEPSSTEPSEESASSERSASTEQSPTEAASSPPATFDPPSAAAASEPPAPGPPSATASSAMEPPSEVPEEEKASPVAPVPMARPLVVAVGTTEDVATDTSSVAPEGSWELSTDTGDGSAGDAAASGGTADGRAAELGELHVAQAYYLAQILDSAAMANARQALDGLPHDKRLSQTCNIEAIGQVANAGGGFNPDAVIVDAFSKSTIAGTRLSAAADIFRSEQRWYAFAFDCTLSEDLTEVTAFTFRLGPDVTSVVTGSGSQ